MTKLRPVHPGEILSDRIAEIVHGRRGITPDTALRLARYFDTTPEFWLNLQINYDLEKTKDREMKRIERDVHPLVGAEL
jgi:plasmid maintenance system antidote protein VapI